MNVLESRLKQQHFLSLRRGLRKIINNRNIKKSSSRAKKIKPLLEQPLDLELLAISHLFQRSRQLFYESGGQFIPSLLSTPRSLSTLSLISPQIQYSPIESELLWAAQDPKESKKSDHLMTLVTLTTSLFHEQNHRSLWGFLPPPPSSSGGLRRYLNFAESLVITLDMALGDELYRSMGHYFVETCYLSGATYDPGTTVLIELEQWAAAARSDKKAAKSPAQRALLTPVQRLYRNYLHAALLATYLHLELYNNENIEQAVCERHPELILGKAKNLHFNRRAAHRSARLDPMFINLTNPDWQKRYGRQASKGLSQAGKAPLEIQTEPLNDPNIYLWGERVFERMGL